MSITVTKRRYKLQQTKCIPEILIDMDNLMDVDEDSDEETDESGAVQMITIHTSITVKLMMMTTKLC